MLNQLQDHRPPLYSTEQKVMSPTVWLFTHPEVTKPRYVATAVKKVEVVKSRSVLPL
jgi:hypothetical protein